MGKGASLLPPSKRSLYSTKKEGTRRRNGKKLFCSNEKKRSKQPKEAYRRKSRIVRIELKKETQLCTLP